MPDTMSECSACDTATKNCELNQFEDVVEHGPNNVDDPDDKGSSEELFYELCDNCLAKFYAGTLEAGYLDNSVITEH